MEVIRMTSDFSIAVHALVYLGKAPLLQMGGK